MADSAWWGSREALSKRFMHEVGQMKVQFGTSWQLVLPKPDSPNPLYWRGQVLVNLEELAPAKRKHTLHVVYPDGYPNAAANCYCVDPVLENTGHTYGISQWPFNNGASKMCLFNPNEGVNYGWNPSHSTALTIALWGIQWLYGYYTFFYTGKWPGDEHNVRPVDAEERITPGEVFHPNRRMTAEERLRLLGDTFGG